VARFSGTAAEVQGLADRAKALVASSSAEEVNQRGGSPGRSRVV
jgi:hypothetical protein